MTDFFISYAAADRPWAEWLAWTLEEAGYSATIDVWDFPAGSLFPVEMSNAIAESDCVLVVLSDNYLQATHTHAEWAAGYAKDPKGINRGLLLVRIDACEPEPLLSSRIRIELAGLTEKAAQTALLKGLEKDGKPASKPGFPGEPVVHTAPSQPAFPGPIPIPEQPSSQPEPEKSARAIPWTWVVPSVFVVVILLMIWLAPRIQHPFKAGSRPDPAKLAQISALPQGEGWPASAINTLSTIEAKALSASDRTVLLREYRKGTNRLRDLCRLEVLSDQQAQEMEDITIVVYEMQKVIGAEANWKPTYQILQEKRPQMLKRLQISEEQ